MLGCPFQPNFAETVNNYLPRPNWLDTQSSRHQGAFPRAMLAMRPVQGCACRSGSNLVSKSAAVPKTNMDLSTWGSLSSCEYNFSKPRLFEPAKTLAAIIWKWFRSYPLFVQLLLIAPALCGLALTLIVGNMGPAFIGMAVATYSAVAGWFGGVFGAKRMFLAVVSMSTSGATNSIKAGVNICLQFA